MSKKLALVLGLNNIVLGGAVLYLYNEIQGLDKFAVIVLKGLQNALSQAYQNEFVINQIIAFLSQ